MASIPLLLRLSPLPPSAAPPPNNRYLPRLPHPLKSPFTTPFPFPRPTTTTATSPPPQPRRRTTTISMSKNTTPATDRLISAAAFFLPFFNGLQYGRFLISKYPSLAVAFEPILPFLGLYRSIPFASFVVFFAIYLGVVKNQRLSRYVRLNALQAMMLDILLILPIVFQRILSPGRAGLGFNLMVLGHNAVFVFVVCCFVYSVVCCILGRTPYIPFVAEAAEHQLS